MRQFNFSASPSYTYSPFASTSEESVQSISSPSSSPCPPPRSSKSSKSSEPLTIPRRIHKREVKKCVNETKRTENINKTKNSRDKKPYKNSFHIMESLLIGGSLIFSALLVGIISPGLEFGRREVEIKGKEVGIEMYKEETKKEEVSDMKIKFDRLYVLKSDFKGQGSKIEVLLYSLDSPTVIHTELFGDLAPGYVYTNVSLEGNNVINSTLTLFKLPESISSSYSL